MSKELSAGGLAEDISVQINNAKVLMGSIDDKLCLLRRNITPPGGYGEILRDYIDQLMSLVSITEGILLDAERDQDKLVDILYRRKPNAEAD